jgi:HEAT repeat protein
MEQGALILLLPLLLDPTEQIQAHAALAVGRLASSSEVIAEQVVTGGILAEIIKGLQANYVPFKLNSCYVIRSISVHGEIRAQDCVDKGCLIPLVRCLHSPDPVICEAAAFALGSIATHSEDLANAVATTRGCISSPPVQTEEGQEEEDANPAVDANLDPDAVHLLVECSQIQSLSLKRIAVLSLGDIAKHSEGLARSVAAAGAIPVIVPYLDSSNPSCDPRLKQQVCYTLAQIAKHCVELAQEVVAGEIFPMVLFCLKDQDEIVRRLAAGLVREIVKHTQELSQLVMLNGGGAALVQYLKPENKNEPLNAVMAVGHIASFSQSLALSLMSEHASAVVLNVFVSARNYQPRTAKSYETLIAKTYQVMTAAAWAIGQIGKHSPEHALKLTNLNALFLLLDAHNDPEAP